MESLARRFRLIAWDAPGYGGSDALEAAAPAAAHYAEVLGGFDYAVAEELLPESVDGDP